MKLNYCLSIFLRDRRLSSIFIVFWLTKIVLLIDSLDYQTNENIGYFLNWNNFENLYILQVFEYF